VARAGAALPCGVVDDGVIGVQQAADRAASGSEGDEGAVAAAAHAPRSLLLRTHHGRRRLMPSKYRCEERREKSSMYEDRECDFDGIVT